MRKGRKGTSMVCFEIDYDYFYNHFWQPNAGRLVLGFSNCHLAWTEIFSVIKGSANSGISGLNKKEYLETVNTNGLSTTDQGAIFRIYRLYQKWKTALGGYDLMDIVNYLIFHIESGRYEGPTLHYVMVDEVQDLTYATIKLLALVTRFNCFFSGDTAQCITKGVSFRFSDMIDTVFRGSDKKPTLKQLTTNFRSHNNILQVAHSVVEVIEDMFPNSIDCLVN